MGLSRDQSIALYGVDNYAGWGEREAAADHAANPNKFGNQSSGGGSSSGGFQQLSAPDIAALRTQIEGVLSPYYQELAKQAKGDFDLAIKMMTTDYTQGTRQEAEKLAYEKKYGTADLQGTLSSLGLSFNQENNNVVDNLNKRGMAVYENNPDGTPNVVTPTTTGTGFTPTFDTNNYTYTPGVSASPTESLGRGGYELGQLRSDQALRSEALLRAKMQPLEQAGMSYKQFTNPSAGFDPSNPSAFQGDRSQLGTAETSAINTANKATQSYRDTSQNLANQKSQSINTLANTYATQGVKQLGNEATNQLQKEYNTDFVKGGVI